MSTLAALLQQRTELENQIANVQREAKAGAVSQVKALMAEHGLSISDLNGAARPAVKAAAASGRAKVAPKYRNMAGETWSGRGIKPRWLTAALANGATLEQFRI